MTKRFYKDIELVDWQFCRKWHLGIDKTYSVIEGFGKKYRFVEYWVFIGPLQMRFRKLR